MTQKLSDWQEFGPRKVAAMPDGAGVYEIGRIAGWPRTDTVVLLIGGSASLREAVTVELERRKDDLSGGQYLRFALCDDYDAVVRERLAQHLAAEGTLPAVNAARDGAEAGDGTGREEDAG